VLAWPEAPAHHLSEERASRRASGVVGSRKELGGLNARGFGEFGSFAAHGGGGAAEVVVRLS
jgi:hypothetical protein